MRVGIFLFGIVLVVLGAVLAFFPLLPAGSEPGGIYYQSKSLLVPSYTTVAWSNGTSDSYVVAIDCGATAPTAIQSNGTASQVCDGSPGTLLASGNGPSGSMTVAAPVGDWIVVASFASSTGPVQPGTSLTGTSTSGLLGIPILILGVVVVLVGAALRPHPKGGRAPPRSPTGPGTAAWGQPSYDAAQQPYPPSSSDPYAGQPGYYPPGSGYPGQDPYGPYPGPPYPPQG